MSKEEQCKEYIRQQTISSVIEEIEGIKKPLWNDNPDRYLENVARHNLIDEILTLLKQKIN